MSYKEEPLEFSPAFELISKLININDETTLNAPSQYDMDKLESYHAYFPVIFFMDPMSPLRPLYDQLSPDLKEELKEWASLAYEEHIMTDFDADVPQLVKDFCLRKAFGTLLNGDIDPKTIYEPEFFKLSAEEQLIKEAVWRVWSANEMKFAETSVLLGYADKYSDDPVKKAEELKKIQAEYDNVHIPDAKAAIVKVAREWKKVKEIVADSECAVLLTGKNAVTDIKI